MVYLQILMFCMFLEYTAGIKYYVTAKPDGSDCPKLSSCHNLSFYTKSQDAYFVDDAYFHFLEGDHILEHSIIVSGVTNVSLVGEPKSISGAHETIAEALSVISCSRSGGIGNIIFNNCSSRITLNYITIKNCSNTSYFFEKNYPPLALFFHEVFDTFLDHVAVIGSNGIGLVVWNGYGMHIESSSFAQNNINNVYAVYTPLNECILYDESVSFYIFASNFSFSQYGISIFLNQSLLYQVNSLINSIVAYGNSENNIGFTQFDGHHRLQVRNSLFSKSLIGINIIFREREKNGLDESDHAHADIELSESQLLNNHRGIYLFHHGYGLNITTVSIQILGCSIAWNSDSGVNFGVVSQTYPVTLQMQNTWVYENSVSIGQDNAVVILSRIDAFLKNIHLTNNHKTGLLLSGSIATITGSDNLFFNNSGNAGGAMRLFQSNFIFGLNTALKFISNNARKGSVVYVTGRCVFHVSENLLNKTLNNIVIVFENNTAEIPGDLYYEFLAIFCTISLFSFEGVFNLIPERFSFATNVIGVCHCSHDFLKQSLDYCYDNNDEVFTMMKYPGQEIEIPLTTVGVGGPSSYSLTDGTVMFFVNNQFYREIAFNGTDCYPILYEVNRHSLNATTTELYFQVSGENVLPSTREFLTVRVNLTFRSCPEGFRLLNGICQCIGVLEDVPAQINCTINKTGDPIITVSRDDPAWYGTMIVNNQTCYVVNIECKYTYCYSSTVTFNLFTESNSQCRSGRSGFLCGHCAGGKSLLLGTDECGDCKNSSLALLLVFILAGFCIILFIILLNLTVSVGTINGLIFYANILKLYEDILFPEGSILFVSQFISWINLDFGIETCFFSGLDTYTKSWLQFVFPIYLWLIIVMIVILSRCSIKFSRLLGSRIVPAISTLLLLSYVKLLRSLISVLTPQQITISCSDDSEIIHQTRWFADPNIHYFETKHAVLVIFAVAMLILFVIPYTVVLLFSPLLDGPVSSVKRCQFWSKLKPVFDSYNAPYKDKTRFWTGFLLVARLFVLFTVSSTNPTEKNRVWLLSVVQAVIAVIFVVGYSIGGVYRIWFLNLLDACFLLNLTVIMIAATNGIFSSIYQTIFITSISLSFVGFIGIIILHAYLALSKGGHSTSESKMQALSRGLEIMRRIKSDKPKSTTISELSLAKSVVVPYSSIDVQRESLLFSDGYVLAN